MKIFSNGGKFSSPKAVKPTGKRNSENHENTAPVAAATVAGADDKLQVTAATQAAKPAKTKNDKKIWIVAALIFLSIMLATLIYLKLRSKVAADDFKNLAQQVQSAEQASPVTVPTESAEENVSTEPTVKTILPKYAGLYQQNPELFGWVRIDDTVINYPVMRSFEDNDEYLYANFEGKYSFAGIPFADIKCSNESDNILIYGHNIKDGSMFAGLFKYESEEYYKEHPVIIYSDLYEDYEYEILSVFYDRVYKKSDTNFKFYQFIDAADEEEYDYSIARLKAKSIYDTGVEAEYGDKLIMLVTCAYHVDDGRFVVVARRK